MNYRSTNPEGYVHFGGDVMSGANSSRGVLLSSNTVSPVSDNTNEDLVLKGKGTGGVYLGNSTVVTKGIWAGASTIPTLALAANALELSTITVPGAAVGDAFLVGRSTSMSTALAIAGSYISAANEGTFAVLNNAASTQSIVGGSFTYAVVKA